MGGAAPDGSPFGSRTIRILHFNDVYDICPRATDPVGGAARMAARLRSLGSDALVLFSGDAFHPSLLSTVTQGKQMVEVLNACNVKAACVGNHDFDGSVETFEELAAECRFPWLMANVVDAATGRPLGGARPTLLLEWGGVRLGLMGLVEREWLTTLAAVDPDAVRYTDFVEEGTRLAAQLRAEGAEAVVALTHMRLPNDLRLAEGVPGIDLVLGGHDHDYFLVHSQKYGTPVVKSGTDFREFTEIELTLGPADLAPDTAGAAGAAGAATAGAGAGSLAAGMQQPGSPPATPRSLVVTARQLPGRVADSLAGLPDQMARLALRSHQRCSKWAKLAGIPALAGCNLSAGEGDDGQGSPCGSPVADMPHCLQSPRGGGPNATPAGKSAAQVYEEAAVASLATSLVASRLAGGGGVAGPSGAAGDGRSSGSGSGGGRADSSSSAPPLQLTFHCLRHIITSELPEDPEVAAIVERYDKLMGERMDVVVGYSAIDLDGRFSTVRTGESNLGNFISDVWRHACHADVALLNAGTLRSDRIHPVGEVTHRDLVSVLPMLDETVVIEVTGAQLLAALENGVSQWPKLEGRFPQVSGVRFSFDPSLPPGRRVVPGSVSVGDAVLRPDSTYSLATKAYLAEGRDGYDALRGAKLLVDSDCTPLLPTVIANHFLLLRTLNRAVEVTGRRPAWQRAAELLLNGSDLYIEKSQQRLREEGTSHTSRKHPLTGRWEIAPVLDGRIRRVGGSTQGGGGTQTGSGTHGGS